MEKTVPTPELLRKLLRYDSETGKLFWRERPVAMFKTGARTAEHSQKIWNTRYAGEEAFTANYAGGYRGGCIFHRIYLAHRIIWAMETGAWPEAEIDHINHDTADNRWVNIRAATRAENSKNQSLCSLNTSGVCGVSWHTRDRKWRAYIKGDGKAIHLGYFVDKVDAAKARRAAEKQYGFHANHGNIR